MDPWFKFYASDYLLDPEVDALPLEAQGILVRIWCLCWRDSVVPSDPGTLARRAMVDPKAMRKHWASISRFFQKSDGGMVSPRMERERSESRAKAESRRLGAQKTNAKRWGNRPTSESHSDHSATGQRVAPGVAKRPLERVAEVSPSESESESEVHIPPLTPPGGTAEPDEPASAPDPSPVVTVMPCVGAGPKTWSVTERMLEEWAPAYPALDLRQEVERMRLWLLSHRERRKTARGMPRFALAWLSRAQDTPRGSRQTSPPRSTSRATEADQAFLDQLDAIEAGA